MKQHTTAQIHINSKASCTVPLEAPLEIPLEKLIQRNHKVCRLEKLINWKYLDKNLGHLFNSEQAPPSRLILGLLYLQSIDNLSYSEVISIWEESPEWQHFCGQKFLNETFPLHEALLSIWSRVVGEQGRESMTRALGTVQPDVTWH